MLKSVLLRMDRALESPPYNLIIHSVAVLGGGRRVLSLARGAHAEADAHGGLRVGDRLLHQPDVAGGSGAGPPLRASRRTNVAVPVLAGRPWLKACPAVWYVRLFASGNNSVVECDLAKVEVAGSNPVSRSNLRSRARASVGKPSEGCPPTSRAPRRRRSAVASATAEALEARRRTSRPHELTQPSDRRRRQVVRQRSAKPPPPVQIRAAPPIHLRNQRLTDWREVDRRVTAPKLCPPSRRARLASAGRPASRSLSSSYVVSGFSRTVVWRAFNFFAASTRSHSLTML